MPKKRLKGKIVSDKMQKTVVVRVERIKEHPKYRKRYRVFKKYKAHVEGGNFKVGDEVIIEECRPLSKEKKWRVIGKVRKLKAEPRLKKEVQQEGEIREEVKEENKEEDSKA
jgi:small subunit ribosomal protein S17